MIEAPVSIVMAVFDKHDALDVRAGADVDHAPTRHRLRLTTKSPQMHDPHELDHAN